MILPGTHYSVRNVGVCKEIWSAKKEHNKTEDMGNIWIELGNEKQGVMKVRTELI